MAAGFVFLEKKNAYLLCGPIQCRGWLLLVGRRLWDEKSEPTMTITVDVMDNAPSSISNSAAT
jgi:hypothetical protein